MTIKSFKRFIREGQDTYYTLDLSSDMSREDVQSSMKNLLPYLNRMLKKSDVTVYLEPVIDGVEDES